MVAAAVSSSAYLGWEIGNDLDELPAYFGGRHASDYGADLIEGAADIHNRVTDAVADGLLAISDWWNED